MILQAIEMQAVRSHYDRREALRRRLLTLLERNDAEGYAQLAVGISDEAGNYSAAEHRLGSRIIAENGNNAVLALGNALNTCPRRQLKKTIDDARLRYVRIGVGSEMAMMLRPRDFWVANVRTLWAMLLLRHGDDIETANAELRLYRNADPDSEMNYSLWAELHPNLEEPMKRLSNLGRQESERMGMEPGSLTYLWADAIANELFIRQTPA